MKPDKLRLLLPALFSILTAGYSCSSRQDYYTATDFGKVPKIDGHFHYETKDGRYLEFADSLNFRLLSPNVDTEMPIDEQLEIASELTGRYPGKFAFFGTFSVDSFYYPGFASRTVKRIRECMQMEQPASRYGKHRHGVAG
jgi:hypothetical protein